MISRERSRAGACVLLGLVAACSGGGGGGGPPAGSLPEIGFAAAAQSVEETAGAATVTVELSQVAAQAIVVPVAASGSAVEGVHYALDASTVEIPAGATEASLDVEVLAGLALFEPDVELVLTLADPANADLGATPVHTLRIRNDARFEEIEPNDDVALANDVVGEIAAARAGTIAGHVDGPMSSDEFDVFAVTAQEDVSVALALAPAEVAADVSLWVADASGALTHLFDGAGDGGTEEGVVEAAAGETLYLVVVSLDAPTAYALDVEGASTLVVAGGEGSGLDPLRALGADWPAIARALLARKQPVHELRAEVLGLGVLIDERAGRAYPFLLERRAR